MYKSYKYATLRYSRLLSLSFIGPLLYKFQEYLWIRGATSVIYASNLDCKERNHLFFSLSSSISVSCQSIKFGRTLLHISSPLVMDVVVSTQRLTVKELRTLMWSLVFAKAATVRTKKSLKKFLPENFPIQRVCVIPYRDSTHVFADYIFQTAKALSLEGHKVFIIAFQKPQWIIRLFKNTKDLDGGLKDIGTFVEIVRPAVLFPFGNLPYRLLNINEFIVNISIRVFLRGFAQGVLWCFDPDDYSLVKQAGKKWITVYDCVDYFTTLHESVKLSIEENEKKLIKIADYFFVNSYALQKVKRRIREATVVPLGFDLDSFEKRTKDVSLISIPKPRVCYIGALTYRLDFELLYKVINNLPHVSFIFTDAHVAMPLDDFYRSTLDHIDSLKKMSNVFFVPKTDRRTIKSLIEQSAIGIIPYDVHLQFNKYCYPMKVLEYFYMGKPVVSTPIEELKKFPQLIKMGVTAQEWQDRIMLLLSKPWPKDLQREARKFAEMNSWNNKIGAISKVINLP